MSRRAPECSLYLGTEFNRTQCFSEGHETEERFKSDLLLFTIGSCIETTICVYIYKYSAASPSYSHPDYKPIRPSMRQSFALRHATLIFQTFPGLEHVRCDALAIRRNSRRLRPARRDAGQYSRPVWAAEVAEGPRLVRREQEQGKGPGRRTQRQAQVRRVRARSDLSCRARTSKKPPPAPVHTNSR